MSDEFLRHVESPFHRGPFPGVPTHHASASSSSCGDTVSISLGVEQGRVTAVSHEARGCLVAKAGGSIVCELALGRQLVELDELPVESYLQEYGVQLTPFRRLCALVAWRALQSAIKG